MLIYSKHFVPGFRWSDLSARDAQSAQPVLARPDPAGAGDGGDHYLWDGHTEGWRNQIRRFCQGGQGLGYFQPLEVGSVSYLKPLHNLL